ncbi:L-ascorbate metabolism protein UlaG (beta-lactamase superfamily) [Maribacter vaceletii]|uniref:L-ascorbate metabolism protein UlaG (Beta-lactamase superfamily) n=2 Tax=Maribacter vaceletii TaxID=1206816 RepID=A0A495E7X7_9FLAO|nr:L-ascorbate metabolism protein UlaG (beta-lactamase superfamily) [Maribacter vaceletii]
MLAGIGITLIVIGIGITLFVNLSPEFGGSPSKEQKEKFAASSNYKKGTFINLGDVKMNMNFSNFTKMLKLYFSPQPNTIPKKDITVQKIDSVAIVDYKEQTRLVWFGHSTFLLQMNTKNILIDPMFGKVPAPHPLLGNNRFSKELPIEIEKLPKIDAVILSHDHYDHLDYGSIQKLKGKVSHFYTPLGVGAHLQAWGIPKENITELDWWQENTLDDLKLVCTPAQHFSGRGLNDRGTTLWSSWVIQSSTENIFFSGDSGYGPHFKEIGTKYGPFDIGLLECGQYNKLWSEIHMMPEETAQAGIDIKAKTIMPIHWGAFKLAMHSWTDPVERILNKANELKINTIVPQIGEPIYLKENPKNSLWWKN